MREWESGLSQWFLCSDRRWRRETNEKEMATLTEARISIMVGGFTKLMSRPRRLVSVRASDRLLTRQARHYPPSPPSESVYPLLHFCVESWNLLAVLYSMIISFYSSYSYYDDRYCFPIKVQIFRYRVYNEGFLMADKHGGRGCCFSAS